MPGLPASLSCCMPVQTASPPGLHTHLITPSYSHSVGLSVIPTPPFPNFLLKHPIFYPSFWYFQAACFTISTTSLSFSSLGFPTHWFLIFLITHHYLLFFNSFCIQLRLHSRLSQWLFQTLNSLPPSWWAQPFPTSPSGQMTWLKETPHPDWNDTVTNFCSPT